MSKVEPQRRWDFAISLVLVMEILKLKEKKTNSKIIAVEPKKREIDVVYHCASIIKLKNVLPKEGTTFKTQVTNLVTL